MQLYQRLCKLDDSNCERNLLKWLVRIGGESTYNRPWTRGRKLIDNISQLRLLNIFSKGGQRKKNQQMPVPSITDSMQLLILFQHLQLIQYNAR